MTDATPHLYLVDGSGFIFRAYHAIRPGSMNRPDGTPVNAVYGFSSMLFKLLQDLRDGERPSHLAVIFDAAKKTFRNDIYPEYKAHRPPAPEDLVPQFSIIREAVEAFGVKSLEMPGYEADDLIATYAVQARKKGWDVTIVSSDKDLMQLVDQGTTMFDSMKNKRIGIDGVHEKFGVGPEKVIDVQALAGDSADNVPGVPGIGVKTAAQLINDYGDLDTLLDRAAEIKQNKRRENLLEFADQARISRDLVTLKVDCPITDDLETMAVKNPVAEDLLSFIDTQSFRSLRTKVINHYGADLEDTAHQAADNEIEKIETDYSCITTLDDLSLWIEAAYSAGVIAVDTETTGLDATAVDLVGISLSIDAGKACYIPLAHKGDSDDMFAVPPTQIDKAKALAALKPLFEDESVLKIGQNMKYDMTILAREGIAVSPIDDTMLMSYALDAGRHGHGMDELSGINLDITPVAFKEIAGTGKNQKTFDLIPLKEATHYAAEDADLTGRLARILKPRLAAEKVRTVYETLERPLVKVLSDMEQAGIKVDGAELRRLSNEFAEGIQRLEIDIHDLAGRPFNIASPKQLGEILFEDMGLKGGKKSKTGAFSTNVDVLEKLAGEGVDIAQKVIEYRQFAKLKSTYTDALVGQINPATGRVHTSYSLASTTTGRLSSNDPNLQNIPIRTSEGRKIRRAFIPEEGHKLVAADYSQIELRILAHMADIQALKDAFHEGIDIHAMTASQVFGVPVEGMDPMVRRNAKAINFGIIYGISAFGLARQLGISRKEAQGFIDAYFARFPGIRAYMDETIEFAKEKGHVETLFGRKVHIGAIQEKNPMRRQFGERAAINAPIQGTAADVIRRAMIQMPPALERAGLLPDVKMLLQVHDELVFEIPEARVTEASAVIKSTMEAACEPILEMAVPLVVDVGVGDDWEEAH
ncbi:DNA polymerase I [Temperatibacter marinus]|uniref:DNA polymerase I n=1 Tax=Temperatibacter marinus TaxID=1456591 RepID=A0AA52EE69_9PROT|nr:DNA polymerase I [Temperatibacter marinus]WND03812.1 DNA polymerase I [Temperatibacter marinus]